MSWMDSWSRPKKSATTPPPLYLTNGDDVPYCWSCGRVIGSRRSQSAKSSAATAKYCSDRCKRRKPGPLDQRIEEALVLLLQGKSTVHLSTQSKDPSPAPGSEATDFATHKITTTDPNKAAAAPPGVVKGTKGDPRIIVSLSAVETLLFAHHKDPEKTFGRKKNRARRGVADGDQWQSVDMVDRPSNYQTQAGSESAARRSEDNSDDESDDTGSGSDEDEGIEDGAFTDASVGSRGSVESSRSTTNGGVALSADMVQLKLDPHIRPPQSVSDVNGSIGGEKSKLERHEETSEELAKRRAGQRKAEERELVRCVARRGVVFGFTVDRLSLGEKARGEGGAGKKGKGKGKKGGKGKGGLTDEDDDDSEASNKNETIKRKCEAVMQGAVVEPSFAKGDWAIRWRED